MKLRPYQSECLDSIWSRLFKENSALVVLPTSAGKTIIFSKLIKKGFDLRKKAPRILILVNRVTLIEQTIEKLTKVDESLRDMIGVYCGSLNEYDSSKNITVGLIDSISMYKITDNLNFDLCIIDEYHNFYSTNRFDTFFDHLEFLNEKIKAVKFTATPYRFGKRIEEDPCYKLNLLKLINDGYITPYHLLAPECAYDTTSLTIKNGDFKKKELAAIVENDEDLMILQCEDALSRIIGRKKVVWACTTIDHCNSIGRILNDSNENSVVIHSKLNKTEWKKNIDSFENGDTRHLVTVLQVSEGYDYSAIDCIICMRPTRSANLYVQLIGRGLRLHPGKEDCLFVDYGEVVINLGDPNDPILEGDGKKEATERELVCPKCRSVIFYTGSFPDACDYCGYVFEKEIKEREVNRLKNLTLTPHTKKDVEKEVDFVSINNDYTSRSGDKYIVINFYSGKDVYRQYIRKDATEYWQKKEYYKFLEESELILKTKKVRINSKSFVVKRIYDERAGHSEFNS